MTNITQTEEQEIQSKLKNIDLINTIKSRFNKLGVKLDNYTKIEKEIEKVLIGNKYNFLDAIKKDHLELSPIYKTPLWIVSGDSKKMVADHICRKCITWDVASSLCFYSNVSYVKVTSSELAQSDFETWNEILKNIKGSWLLYLSALDMKLFTDKRSAIIKQIIMDRLESNLLTVISLSSNDSDFTNLVQNVTWTDTIKTITTK